MIQMLYSIPIYRVAILNTPSGDHVVQLVAKIFKNISTNNTTNPLVINNADIEKITTFNNPNSMQDITEALDMLLNIKMPLNNIFSFIETTTKYCSVNNEKRDLSRVNELEQILKLPIQPNSSIQDLINKYSKAEKIELKLDEYTAAGIICDNYDRFKHMSDTTHKKTIFNISGSHLINKVPLQINTLYLVIALTRMDYDITTNRPKFLSTPVEIKPIIIINKIQFQLKGWVYFGGSHYYYVTVKPGTTNTETVYNDDWIGPDNHGMPVTDINTKAYILLYERK